MPYKIIINLMFLFVFLGGSLALNAETLQRDKSFSAPSQFISPRYFYTKCRDSSSLIRNPEEIDFSNPHVMANLAACTVYAVASLDWFCFLLTPMLGKEASNCYFETTLKKVSFTSELLSSIISFMNMHEDLLDDPSENTPSIFSQAI